MANYRWPATKRDIYEANFAAATGGVRGAGLRFLRGGGDSLHAGHATSDSTEQVAADMAEQAHLAARRAKDALQEALRHETNRALQLMLREALGYLEL